MVDWENSGWSDPAFEIADLLTHPAYVSVPRERWFSVAQRYNAQFNDNTLVTRIATYQTMMFAWWAIFFAREHFTCAHGKQAPQLVERPAAWRASLPIQAAHYLDAATSAVQHARLH